MVQKNYLKKGSKPNCQLLDNKFDFANDVHRKEDFSVFKTWVHLLLLLPQREQKERSSLFPETYEPVCFLSFFIKILNMKYVPANEKPKCTCPH